MLPHPAHQPELLEIALHPRIRPSLLDGVSSVHNFIFLG
jgi:hypothetical protein